MANSFTITRRFRNRIERQRYYRMIRRLNGDHAMAEDLLQEANLRAVTKYGDSDEVWSNIPLLATIDRNVFCDLLKRRRCRPLDQAGSIDRNSQDDPDKGPGENILGRAIGVEAIAYREVLLAELRQLLLEFGEKLSASQRRFLECADLSITECAKLFDTTRGSVKTQRSKLRRRLRDNARLYGLAVELLCT